MQQYKEFRPTGFDSKDIFLQDQREWYVVPVSRNRDSGCLAESNFDVALELLGGESETVEVHRFGHWANGWFEIIIVHPTLIQEVQEIEDSLEQYPILDEMHYSALQWDQATDTWEHMPLQERVECCQRFRVNIFQARHDRIPEGIEIDYLLGE